MRLFFQTFLYVNVGIGTLFFGIWLWTAFFPFSTGAQVKKNLAPPPKTPANQTPANQTSANQTPANQNQDKKKATPTPVAKKESSPTVPSTQGATSPSNPKKESSPTVPSTQGATSPSNPKKESSPTVPSTQGVASPSNPKKESSPTVPSTQGVASPSNLKEKPPTVPSVQGATSSSNLKEKPPTVPSVQGATSSSASLESAPTTALPPNQANQDPKGSSLAQQTGEGNNRAPNAIEDISVPPPPPSVQENLTKTDLNSKIKSAQNLGKQAGEMGADVANELMDVNQRVVAIEKMMSPYEYDPTEKRDPFIPFRPKGQETMEEEVLNYATSEYELSEIKLIGMKWGKGPKFSKAMFKTPDSEIHYLQANDRIGNGGAIIDRLEEDKVVVLEPRFAVESQSQSTTTDGSKRVFVPKIIHLSRFVSKGSEPKDQSRPVVSSQAKNTPSKQAKKTKGS